MPDDDPAATGPAKQAERLFRAVRLTTRIVEIDYGLSGGGTGFGAHHRPAILHTKLHIVEYDRTAKVLRDGAAKCVHDLLALHASTRRSIGPTLCHCGSG